jgi:hypothetical protein
MQSYLLYASLFGVSVYLCSYGYKYLKLRLLQKIHNSSTFMLDLQFKTLELFLNKEKLDVIRNELVDNQEDFVKNKISYQDWKSKTMATVDELFDLFDDYYYR